MGGDVVKHRWVTRTIKDGRVKVFGHVYAPEPRAVPYDGRLDGQRWVFGRYEHRPDLLAMWGTDECARAETQEEYERLWEAAPNVFEAEDSASPGRTALYVNWYFWHEVDDGPTCPGYPDRCDACRSTETLMAPEPGCFAYIEDEER